MLSSLPEDCILEVLNVTHLLDIIRLRRTCRELNRITRNRGIWMAIYPRVSYPAIAPPIPAPFTLEDIPPDQLEKLCTYAHKLRVNWSSRVPSPTRVFSVTPQFLPGAYSSFLFDTHEPLRWTFISPGGRWLIIITSQWTIHVCDLSSSIARTAITRRDIRDCADEQLATCGYDSSQILLSDLRAQVRWSKDLSTARVSLQLVGCGNHDSVAICTHQEWTIQIPPVSDTHNNTVDPLHADESGRLKFSSTLQSFTPALIPDHVIFGEIDNNEGLVSYYVHLRGEIHIQDYETGKGIAMYGKELKGIDNSNFGHARTRTLRAGDQIFVLCLNSRGSVHIYLVPLLREVESNTYPRIEVRPIATDKIQYLIEHMGPWQPSISQGSFCLQILSLGALWEFTFIPETLILRWTRLQLPLLPESFLINIRSYHGPARQYYGRMGTSGSRGVMVTDDDRSRQVLHLVVQSTSHSAGKIADELADIPDGLRKILGGLGSGRYTGTCVDGAAIAFDETTGRMCFLKLKPATQHTVFPEFRVVDFAPMELLRMYY